MSASVFLDGPDLLTAHSHVYVLDFFSQNTVISSEIHKTKHYSNQRTNKPNQQYVPISRRFWRICPFSRPTKTREVVQAHGVHPKGHLHMFECSQRDDDHALT